MISVIIPCFNARRWVAETVASALQPCAESVEVIVVDDGSTDGSAEVVRRLCPPVRLVSTPNRGVSHARNLGVSLARGEYLVFLDADDLLAAGKLDRQLRLLRETGADVVYGNWQCLRPGPDGTFGPAEMVERTMERDPEIELLTNFWCPTGAYLYRRAIVERVGGFSPRLPVIQDARLALDCALHGARFVHDAGLSCLYRAHVEDSVSTRSRAAFLRDCLASAIEVRDWWESRGALVGERRAALLGVFDYLARMTCGLDEECFTAACAQFEQVRAGRAVPGRAPNRLLARLLGYRRAQRLASPLRRLRQRMYESFPGTRRGQS
jgi:glycosyltransferase involved in cell wall biosynthesis